MNCESELAFGAITSIEKPPVIAIRAFVAQTEISPLRKLLPQQSSRYAIAYEHKRGKTVGNAGQRHINLNIQNGKPQPMPWPCLELEVASFACCEGAAEIQHLVRSNKKL
jgi:hypothetical protein